MVLALVVSLLSGQVIYEWIDAKGDSHFTDDVSTIPPKAKRRVTSGVEPIISVPRSDGGSDAGGSAAVAPRPRPQAPAGPDSCALARKRLEELEQQVAREKLAFEQAQAREDQRCQEVLNLSGRGAFAQCMASRTQAAPPSSAASRMEEAQDALRRAQVGGCR